MILLSLHLYFNDTWKFTPYSKTKILNLFSCGYVRHGTPSLKVPAGNFAGSSNPHSVTDYGPGTDRYTVPVFQDLKSTSLSAPGCSKNNNWHHEMCVVGFQLLGILM